MFRSSTLQVPHSAHWCFFHSDSNWSRSVTKNPRRIRGKNGFLSSIIIHWRINSIEDSWRLARSWWSELGIWLSNSEKKSFWSCRLLVVVLLFCSCCCSPFHRHSHLVRLLLDFEIASWKERPHEPLFGHYHCHSRLRLPSILGILLAVACRGGNTIIEWWRYSSRDGFRRCSSRTSTLGFNQ